MGFKGSIYATEPTIQFGRMAMEELLDLDKQYRAQALPSRKVPVSSFLSTKRSTSSQSTQDNFARSAKRPKTAGMPGEVNMTAGVEGKVSERFPFSKNSTLRSSVCSFEEALESIPAYSGVRPCYSAADVASCVAKIRPLSYGQVEHAITLAGLLSLTPFSAGFSIGSANWRITLGQAQTPETVGSDSCSPPAPRTAVTLVYISSSCSLNASGRHPSPALLQPLCQADCLLFGAEPYRFAGVQQVRKDTSSQVMKARRSFSSSTSSSPSLTPSVTSSCCSFVKLKNPSDRVLHYSKNGVVFFFVFSFTRKMSL